jgi:hypothetical protein
MRHSLKFTIKRGRGLSVVLILKAHIYFKREQCMVLGIVMRSLFVCYNIVNDLHLSTKRFSLE